MVEKNSSDLWNDKSSNYSSVEDFAQSDQKDQRSISSYNGNILFI